MGESLKPAKLTREELDKYGNFSPDQVAKIVDASLLYDPENLEVVRSFINKVHLNEQFIILLMKSIPLKGGKPELVAWGFRNPYGIAIDPKGNLLISLSTRCEVVQ